MSRVDNEEIEEAVGRELGRMGVQGTITLVANSIELHAGGTPVSIEIDVILRQWPLLPAEMRLRKAEEIARRLVGADHVSRHAEGRVEVQVDTGQRLRVAVAVGGFFALLFLVGLARYLIPRFTTPEKVEVVAPTEADAARRERLARACDAVRDRIYQGTSFGPFALEGFVTELWLASKTGASLRDNPAITGVVAGGKLAPSADDKLSQIIDGTLEIADGFDADAARRERGWSAVTLVFRGGYARAFLEEEHRPRFLGLADRVAVAAGVEHAALYGRCAHRTTHDVGAWFRGPDLPGAAAVMVYQMGFFSEARMIDRSALAAVKPTGGELDALRKAAGDVEGSIGSFVGTAGGSVTGAHPTTLAFPLAAPVRGVSATRNLVRKMGVGVLAGE